MKGRGWLPCGNVDRVVIGVEVDVVTVLVLWWETMAGWRCCGGASVVTEKLVVSVAVCWCCVWYWLCCHGGGVIAVSVSCWAV